MLNVQSMRNSLGHMCWFLQGLNEKVETNKSGSTCYRLEIYIVLLQLKRKDISIDCMQSVDVVWIVI